jgi:hypothetical protein
MRTMTRQLTENRSYSLTRTGVMRRAALRGPAPTVPFRNTNYIPQKAAGSFVPKITKAAFEKFGFPAAALLTDWAKIAGADVAAYTLPERLKWSRKAASGAEANDDTDGRPGAELVLRVDPARALDIDYKSRMLIERINQYFGYQAVGSIRVMQGHIDPQVAAKIASQPAARPAAATAPLGQAADPLEAALDRLGSHVAARKTARKSV